MIQIVNKHFTELNTKELYQILQLRNEVFILEQNCFYQDLDNKDYEAYHVLMYIDDRLIGTCRILPNGISYENYCSIGRVCVAKKERQHKYGIELMQFAIEKCKELFEGDIKISAQQYLEKFYTNLGFTTVSETYLEDDIPHIAMVMLLS